jgi:hypothetical protein
MSKYDVEVEYLPGKDNVLADTLSRVDPNRHSNTESDLKEILEIPVNFKSQRITTQMGQTLSKKSVKIPHWITISKYCEILSSMDGQTHVIHARQKSQISGIYERT